jgi:hypothetical protein
MGVKGLRLLIVVGAFCAAASAESAIACKYDGPGGGTFTITDPTIDCVNGGATWILVGNGQAFVMQIKDGDGTLHLQNFNGIRIEDKKDGSGHLVIDANNKGQVYIKQVNGQGGVYLLHPGPTRIEYKDGDGNVCYNGQKPVVVHQNGSGQIVQGCGAAP